MTTVALLTSVASDSSRVSNPTAVRISEKEESHFLFLSLHERQQNEMESRIFNEVQDTKRAFAASTPYLHAVLQDLVQPELLKEVRKEVLSQLHFTEKETDIYRVQPPFGYECLDL